MEGKRVSLFTLVLLGGSESVLYPGMALGVGNKRGVGFIQHRSPWGLYGGWIPYAARYQFPIPSHLIDGNGNGNWG